MTTKDFTRKLSAILSADVAGYSRLMGEDEAATVEAITAYREIMAGLITQHRGRVIDSPGDNILAEFTSVVDAVQCAVAVQKEFQSRNAVLPENRRMEFRIGINLGDVIEEGERIYGDGVNIAARLEALADPGGICVSKTAFDQIETKLPFGYEYLGEKEVKNITKPVGAFRVLMDEEAAGKVIGELKPKTRQLRGAVIGAVVVLILGAAAVFIWNSYFRPKFEPAKEEKMAYPLPDKPSIAVLPFTNMSEDPKQEYFTDGMTEQIITGLSKIPRLFVISRNSTFTYKGKPVKVKQVAEDLGVRYVLEGSVQRSGDRIRITAQLIDALEGNHLWSERYDRDLKDIFALQNEITMKIMAAMRVKLTAGEQASLYERGTDNLDAYEKHLQGVWHLMRNNKEDNVIARKLLEEAIALDPEYAGPHVTLAWTHVFDIFLGVSKSPKESLIKGIKLAKKAIALDESYPMAHSCLGVIYVFMRQFEKGVEQCERAVELGPNYAYVYMNLGTALRFAGRWAEAIPVYEKAIRLSPFPSSQTFYGLGLAYCYTGQFDKGIEACKRATLENPNDFFAPIFLTVAYSMGGREEEARATAEKIMGINPKFSVNFIIKKAVTYKNKADVERFAEALRKAGLPETPPLPLPDKPSIAVLPFVNMSGDPEQEYFSDGIAEEIITALSKSAKLFVIARNSTFTYKGKPVWVPKVGKELGVRYVLEGSVRKAGDKVRVTAQLIDAETNKHIWAERYDRELKDIFAIQDEITMKIITALQVKLTEGEQARMWGARVKNLDAYLKLLEARSLWAEGSKKAHIRFGQVAQEVIDMVPDSAVGYNLMSWHYWYLGLAGKSPRESIGKAFKLAQKVLSMDETDSRAHALLGSVYLLMRQYDKAIAAGKESVELEPNGAMVHGLLGNTLSYAGRPDEAIIQLNQGIRLNPRPPAWYYCHLGRCYRQKGQYEKSLAEFKKALKFAPNHLGSQIGLTVMYSLLGREEEARAAGKKLLEMDPNFSVERLKKISPYKNQADTKQIVDALRKAGLK